MKYLDIDIIAEDLNNWHRIRKVFSEQQQRIYTAGQYKKFIEKYRNIQNAEKDASLLSSNFSRKISTLNKFLFGNLAATPARKLNLIDNALSYRIYTMLLISVKNIKKLQVTSNFYPLYLSIIDCYCKTLKWNEYRKDILNTAKYLVSYCKFDSSINTLYEYWINLFIPEKLYNLIMQMDKFLKTKENTPFYSGFSLNMMELIRIISQSFLFSSKLQNLYLDNILSSFKKHSKEDMFSSSKLVNMALALSLAYKVQEIYILGPDLIPVISSQPYFSDLLQKKAQEVHILNPSLKPAILCHPYFSDLLQKQFLLYREHR